MGLVQHASGSASSGTTVSATFGAGTTSGNTIIVVASGEGSSATPSVSSVALTGGSDTFLKAAGAQNTSDFIDNEIWYDNSNSAGHTVVTVTFSATLAGGQVDIYEWSGITTSSPLDKTMTGSGSSTSWSTGATATLTQASEVAFAGVGGNAAGSMTYTGPSSPWTNEAQVTSSAGFAQLSGFQQVSATTALTYNGTVSSSTFYAACIATFKLAAASPAGTVQPRATVPVPRRRPGRALWQRITGQAPVQVPAPAQQPRPAPRRKPARAVIVFTPVRTVNAVPPSPVNGTVQPRATVPARSRRPARALILFTPPAPPRVPAGTVQSRATLVTARRRPARAVTPAPPGPLIPLVPAVTEGGPVYYPYHHRGRGRTR